MRVSQVAQRRQRPDSFVGHNIYQAVAARDARLESTNATKTGKRRAQPAGSGLKRRWSICPSPKTVGAEVAALLRSRSEVGWTWMEGFLALHLCGLSYWWRALTGVRQRHALAHLGSASRRLPLAEVCSA